MVVGGEIVAEPLRLKNLEVGAVFAEFLNEVVGGSNLIKENAMVCLAVELNLTAMDRQRAEVVGGVGIDPHTHLLHVGISTVHSKLPLEELGGVELTRELVRRIAQVFTLRR